MLKRSQRFHARINQSQPPSGGCVLKRFCRQGQRGTVGPAAFRRLCVETMALLTCSICTDTSRLQAAVC